MEFVVVKIFKKMKYYRKMTFMNETQKKKKNENADYESKNEHNCVKEIS